ncbi:type IV pilin N-terminal domain-containing protein [Halobium salinum]|uniref:Type IV pilin N-terminal domain-containing protein n=1 Tax=Halobium salinum TaxID=1364940 RepID=A0ABD5P8K8_9EURY|nr:type IV pilin N-terminal domain-containing protein [Halobium salinum]
MEFKKLFAGDDRAVSPVIGVILMVAITVILAAVIGTFVLGLGEQVGPSAPQASFSFDQAGSDVTISHDGGDKIEGADLEIRVDGTAVADGEQYTDGSTIGAGNKHTVTGVSGDELQVVYTGSSGKESIIASYQIE